MAEKKTAEKAEKNENRFLKYKGYPLVRKNDELYYGNMSDKYVIWMQITEKTKVGDMDVASKVKIYKMATDENLSPIEAIEKQSEKNSLYEALDIAYAWLSRKAAE